MPPILLAFACSTPSATPTPKSVDTSDTAGPATGCADLWEPNDATPTDLGVVLPDGHNSATIDPAGDVDSYVFTFDPQFASQDEVRVAVGVTSAEDLDLALTLHREEHGEWVLLGTADFLGPNHAESIDIHWHGKTDPSTYKAEVRSSDGSANCSGEYAIAFL